MNERTVKPICRNQEGGYVPNCAHVYLCIHVYARGGGEGRTGDNHHKSGLFHMVADNHHENISACLSACSAFVLNLSVSSYSAKAGNLKTTTWILAANCIQSIRYMCPSFERQK